MAHARTQFPPANFACWPGMQPAQLKNILSIGTRPLATTPHRAGRCADQRTRGLPHNRPDHRATTGSSIANRCGSGQNRVRRPVVRGNRTARNALGDSSALSGYARAAVQQARGRRDTAASYLRQIPACCASGDHRAPSANSGLTWPARPWPRVMTPQHCGRLRHTTAPAGWAWSSNHPCRR